VVKDLLYESYVRRARLRQAIVVRRAAAEPGFHAGKDAVANGAASETPP
jgi:hypothetical protein